MLVCKHGRLGIVDSDTFVEFPMRRCPGDKPPLVRAIPTVRYDLLICQVSIPVLSVVESPDSCSLARVNKKEFLSLSEPSLPEM
jgi:hypothetical protein